MEKRAQIISEVDTLDFSDSRKGIFILIPSSEKCIKQAMDKS